jgi:hypothetical protein
MHKKTKTRFLLSLLATLVIMVFISLLAVPTRLALTMTAEETGRLVFASPVIPGDPFEIRFIHSVHRTPVEEQFRISVNREMVLESVIYESYGVGNPSGPEPGQQFRMENGKLVIERIDRRLPELHQRIGQKVANHELILGEQRYPFSKWSKPGSRVLLKVKRVSLWNLWTLRRGGASYVQQ